MKKLNEEAWNGDGVPKAWYTDVAAGREETPRSCFYARRFTGVTSIRPCVRSPRTTAIPPDAEDAVAALVQLA